MSGGTDPSVEDFAARNRSYYEQADTIGDYEAAKGLFAPEEAIIERRASAFERATLLDIGVGAGRTTTYLRDRCAGYVALDYAEGMVRACADATGASVLWADARSLPSVDQGFGIVFASFNALDDIPHADRLRALEEIRRVLRPDGLLVFSSHNRESAVLARPDRPSRPRLRDIARYARATVRWFLRRRHDEHHGDHSIIFDHTLGGDPLPTYCLDPRQQRDQLATIGFSLEDVVDTSGRSVDPEVGSRDAWLYYVASLSQSAAEAD